MKKCNSTIDIEEVILTAVLEELLGVSSGLAEKQCKKPSEVFVDLLDEKGYTIISKSNP